MLACMETEDQRPGAPQPLSSGAPEPAQTAIPEIFTARRRRLLIVSLIVACAMFMQNLDSTVIATALPTIAHSLGETPLRLNVAITCYLLSLAVFIPISGWTADRFGARRVFSFAIVVFTLGSIACGVSTTLPDAGRRAHPAGHGRRLDGAGRAVGAVRTVPKSDLVRAMSFVSVPALIGPVMAGRRSAALSSPISTGAGSSTSTCRWALSG